MARNQKIELVTPPDDGGREALKRAIEIAGGAVALARKLGVTHSAICQWDRAPVNRALQIEIATDHRVRCHELRPDCFPKPTI